MDRNNLKEQINSLYEVDMGDFKRKVITYLNRYLEGAISNQDRMLVKFTKQFVICYITPEKNIIQEIDDLRLSILQKLES